MSLTSEAGEQVGKKVAEHAFPLLEKIFAKLHAFFAHIGDLFLHDGFFENFARAFFDRLVILFFNDPATRDAAVKTTLELYFALGAHLSMYFGAFIMSLAALSIFPGTFLLWRFLNKRRIKVFVSFNRQREKTAMEVQSLLEQHDLDVFRIPYKKDAGHQEINELAEKGVKSCDEMVCIPGFDQSYVEAEVFGAQATNKTIVFLVSEESGTLPNTADKRYPIFKLERVEAEQFEPLIQFMRYIGADFSSLLDMSKKALRHPWMSFSLLWGMAIALIGMLVLLVLNYLAALERSHELTAGITSVPEVRNFAVLANTFFISLFSTFVICVALYVGLMMLSTKRQRDTQKKAMRKVATGTFTREEWVNLVPGLTVGSRMYECMATAAGLAHHERGQSTA